MSFGKYSHGSAASLFSNRNRWYRLMHSLDDFGKTLNSPHILEDFRAGLIGDGIPVDGGLGVHDLLYADYVASGRALRQVEGFVADKVLPYYANSHTEASFCGGAMTHLRHEARAVLADHVGAGQDCHVIFAGSGATAGLNRICGLLRLSERVRADEQVVVLTGPYEHHSNILPWRESGARVIEIPEGLHGGVDCTSLRETLAGIAGADLIVGSFSAGSNVTGILTDVDEVTGILKAAGALAIWDYAAAAPYVAMDMGRGARAKDALVFSPHKFPGGPGASGVMVVRDTVVARDTPTLPGGGAVSFVSPWGQIYSDRVEAREEAGTPNVVGDIRAALVVMVKQAVGVERIMAREAELRARALKRWTHVPNLHLLGQNRQAHALPIFSFQVRDGKGGLVHHQLFTRMLSDLFGVQARGGCACAGPYAHRLLGIDTEASCRLIDRLNDGEELDKPGWVRLNLSYLHSDEQADRIIGSVAWLAERAASLAGLYTADRQTARFRPAANARDMLSRALEARC